MKNNTLLFGSLCSNSLPSAAYKNTFAEKITVNAKSIHKRWLLMPLMLLGFLFTNGNAWGQMTWYFQPTSGNPVTLSNWNSIEAGGGSSPANFNGASDVFIIPSGKTAFGISAWTVTNQVTVIGTVAPTSSSTNNYTAKTWVIESGANVNLTSGASVVTSSGTFTCAGTVTKTGSGLLTLTSSTATFLNGGTYYHNNHAFNAAIPTATWETGSTCHVRYTGISNYIISNFAQEFYNLIWDWWGDASVNYIFEASRPTFKAGGTFTLRNSRGFVGLANGSTLRTWTIENLVIEGGTLFIQGGGSSDLAHTLTINGNFKQTAGVFHLSRLSTANSNFPILNVKGNFELSGTGVFGLLNVINPAAGIYGILNFNGSSEQTYTGTVAFNGSYVRVNVKTGAMLFIPKNNYISGGYNSTSGFAQFNVEAGAMLKVGDAVGFVNTAYNNSSTKIGAIRMNGTKSYSTSANYGYESDVAQVTGNGLPATVNNLTINNTGGNTVDLTESVAVNNTLTLTNGNMSIGANTLTLNGTVASMSATNSLTGSTSSNLTIGGTGSLGTLFFNQTTPGTTNTLNSLTINRTNIGSVVLGNTVAVSNALTINNGNVNLGNAIHTAGSLSLGGATQNTASSYGGTNSPAGTINTTYFAATTGVVNVGACTDYSITSTAVSSSCTSGASVTLSNTTAANLPIGNYTVYYTLSGTTTGSYNTTMTISTAGSGTFNTGALNTGSTTITIDYLRNGCVSKPVSGNTATFTVNPNLPASVSIAITSGTQTICSGTSVTFTATPTNGGESPTYQWKLNGNSVGTNSAIYTTTGIANNDLVTVVLTSNAICVSESPATSNSILMTVNTNNWIGTTTSWTTPENWTCGVPLTTTEVRISSAGAYPEINSNVTINSLLLDTGTSLKVNPTFNLTVTEAIANSGTLTLENNANLLQSGTTNNNIGNIVVKRDSSLLFRLDYTLWSSPVVSQNLFSFSSLTLTNRFYTYNENTNFYTTLDMFSLGTPALDATSSFQTGRSYLIRSPNNWVSSPSAAAAWTGTFTGVPNTGDITVPIYKSGETKGYNAVGNPYPSPISIASFLSDNSSIIVPTLWFWRKTNGVIGSAYITYSGGTFNSGPSITLTPLDPQPEDVIQPGQGFFVRASSSGSLQFKNQQRVVTNGSFFRNNSQITAAGEGRLWLNLRSNAIVVGNMALGYKEGATNDLDVIYDGEYINDSPLALTSSLPGKELSVQHRAAPFVETDIVPLTFKADVTGTYSIEFNGTDGVLDTQDIYLEDLLLGQAVAIKTNPYTFASEAGTFSNRFRIVYVNNALGTEEPIFNANQVIIYKNEINDFVINSGNVIMANVKVFDVRGRLLQEHKNVNSSQMIIYRVEANQVLLVQITSLAGLVVTKKVVR